MFKEVKEAKQEGRKIRKKVYFETIMAIALLCILAVLFTQNYMIIIRGLVIGTAVAMLNFTLVILTLEKADDMYPRKAQLYTISRYIFIYALYGVAIYISVRYGTISIIGMIVGVLSVNTVIFIMKKMERWSTQRAEKAKINQGKQ